MITNPVSGGPALPFRGRRAVQRGGRLRPERAAAAGRRPLRAGRPAFKTYRKSSSPGCNDDCHVQTDGGHDKGEDRESQERSLEPSVRNRLSQRNGCLDGLSRSFLAFS